MSENKFEKLLWGSRYIVLVSVILSIISSVISPERLSADKIKDFSQPSFGALMLDTVAYVGDLLSFYLEFE